MSAAIILTKGHRALVSLVDLAWLSQWKWCVRMNNRGIPYAVRGERVNGKNRFVHMHRAVYERHYGQIPDGLDVDHRNRLSLVNHASNLRAATRSFNNTNTRRSRRTGDPTWPRGVRFVAGRYQAEITIKNRGVYIGRFNTAAEASEAFTQKHKEIYGNQ